MEEGLGRSRRTRERWLGESSILPGRPDAPDWLRTLVVTLPFLGIQLTWSCEMGQVAPYLLSLGVSQSLVSVTLAAGPLSGFIVQPLVGALSDKCTSKLGRRRPFMLGGSACTAASLLLLGFSPDVAELFAAVGTSLHSRLTIIASILAVVTIDFSANVIGAADRALLLDLFPPEQQSTANAWVGRIVGFGSIFSYFLGGLDLVTVTGGWFGNSQLKVLTVFTVVVLVASHIITLRSFTERILLQTEDEEEENLGLWQLTLRAVADIWRTFRQLPREIYQVLTIQFGLWLGLFPLFFFSSTWIAQIYAVSVTGSPDLSTLPPYVREAAIRAGSRALLFHAIVNAVGAVVIPMVFSAKGVGVRTGPMCGAVRRLPLPFLWTISSGYFALCMMSAWFVDSVWGATLLVTLTGATAAVTHWVPFALLGDLIHNDKILASSRRVSRESSPLIEPQHDGDLQEPPDLLDPDLQDTINFERLRKVPSANSHGSPLAGTIVGLHNVAIVLSQFAVTCLSSILFAILAPPAGSDEPGTPAKPNNSLRLVFLLCGVAVAVTAVRTYKMAQEFARNNVLEH